MTAKIKAFCLHLAASFILIGSTAGFLVFYFYPGALADIAQVYDLLKILIPVDIILGPLLTLFLFSKGKKGLTLDLSIIAICQAIALGYGCYNLYLTRPGFLVFYHDSFYVAPPSIDQSALLSDPRKKYLYVGSFSRPKIINFILDAPLDEKMRLASSSMSSGTPLQFNTLYFHEFHTIKESTLLKNNISTKKLRKNTTDKKILTTLENLEKSGVRYAYIPVMYGNTDKTIVVNLDTKSVEMALDILPY